MLGVVGVCYRGTALREREAAITLLHRIEADLADGQGVVLLITCHRAEIYCCTPEADALCQSWAEELVALRCMPYVYLGRCCFAHLFMVTSGMDSLVVGETEIQGQVRRAYQLAMEKHILAFDLHFLFQKALKEGKSFRSQVCFSPSVTIGSVVEETLTISHKSRQTPLLFVGFSEINRKVATRLRNRGYQCHFCSRCSTPFLTIPRGNPIFKEPYEVIFLGSSEGLCELQDLALDALGSISQRIVFDFNVPRTFASFPPPTSIVYLDMETITSQIKQRQETSSKAVNSDLIHRAIHKQWLIYCSRQQKRKWLKKVEIY